MAPANDVPANGFDSDRAEQIDRASDNEPPPKTAVDSSSDPQHHQASGDGERHPEGEPGERERRTEIEPGQLLMQLGDLIGRHLKGDSAEQEDPTRTVSYLGVLHQALRDLSQWVDKGVAPPASTSYRIDDGQVVVPVSAKARHGVQPVATVTANGGAKAVVRSGPPVRVTARVEVPPGVGKIVSAEWDFEGAGTFPVTVQLSGAPKAKLTLQTNHAFTKPGVYFPALRVASERNGDAKTPYARIQNLSRVRVLVE